tara:strand:+ start:13444 stop:13839 length:396 start_codon:yes stop_codon:yes gene_type:complete
MDKLKDITKEVDNSLKEDNTIKEISIEDVIKYIVNNDTDTKARVTAGRVFQTNKNPNFIETLFKLIEEEIGKMESKNNRDSDNSFFSLNKKILSNNLFIIKEIIKQYNLDEKRISDFVLGTLIQSIYDSKR